MNIKTTEADGKHYATAHHGDRIVYRTPGYLTDRMALADVQCWVAFHGVKMEEDEKVWVPVDGGQEVELPYADVLRIATEYATVRKLSRMRENAASARALAPIRTWARETHNLTTRDMAAITRWYDTVDVPAQVERGRAAVEQARRA
ncbi:hypothetical protein ACFQ8S_06930 [Streptomyces virginiae]|uniref:hypothetical protein n=1 Tax=Streptomyces virginiae TaxID=1961 RepID=UPI0036A0981B